MVTNSLDEEKHREAAARCKSISSLPVPGGKEFLHCELLRHLANSACEREREAAKWLRLMIERHATIEEIARLRGSSKAAVRTLLKLAKTAIGSIASGDYSAEPL
jgi:hypothetical protein